MDPSLPALLLVCRAMPGSSFLRPNDRCEGQLSGGGGLLCAANALVAVAANETRPGEEMDAGGLAAQLLDESDRKGESKMELEALSDGATFVDWREKDIRE